jgi:glutaminyl-tRNA synthetase
MYDRLFDKEDPEEGDEGFLNCMNPNSLEILTGYVEPHLASVEVGSRFQFERLGYFCVDKDSTPEKTVFNLTVNLKDTWAKMGKEGEEKNIDPQINLSTNDTRT